MNTIYIGKDDREKEMGQMLEYSIRKHSSEPIEIQWIDKQQLIKDRFYFRNEKAEKHSTAFSMTRFLTPYLNKFRGWVLFMDIDMLWLDDPNKLFNEYNDSTKSLYCVHHDDYNSAVQTKMDGRPQQNFPKKNYSSFMLFNGKHPDCKTLMPQVVSTQSPAYLHQFQWTKESRIGKLPNIYNWLAGEDAYNTISEEPIRNLHFTLFHPELAKDQNDINNINCPFAHIWYQYYLETFGRHHKYHDIYLELNDDQEVIEDETPLYESGAGWEGPEPEIEEEPEEEPMNKQEPDPVFLSARTKFIRKENNYGSENVKDDNGRDGSSGNDYE